MVGGEDHKTGTASDTHSRFESLRRYGGDRFRSGPPAVPAFEWSGQVEEPVDGMPYIGRNSVSKNVYVATGYSGNGTTFGTLAAMIVHDLVREVSNPWASLYDATRVKPVASASTYLKENMDFPIHFLGDRMVSEPRGSDDIGAGDGAIVKVEGRRLAIHRDDGGQIYALSPVCSHLGCLVKFNR